MEERRCTGRAAIESRGGEVEWEIIDNRSFDFTGTGDLG